ncbi:MAG: T9SS type A sorting domain-containing protein [Fibrobacter sp.]|nr:T9SS type A sorting domain-containing protein [Fibrobacter sp.]
MKNSKIVAGMSLGLSLLAGMASAAVTVNSAEGWLESAFVEWAPVSGATSYNVYADGKKIDNQLIRSYGSYMRADVPGLKAGSHTLKVEASNGEVSAEKTVTVLAHDRAGFAFSNNRVPGAYNADGTLKSGAVVLYISENTKDKVTMDVTTSSKGTTTTCKSFQGILNCMKKGYETRPVDFRFIGNVTDSDSLVQGDMLIDLGSSDNSYVTVEGIGTDAVANGWGIRIKNAQNVEVRNMGIMNVNSSEGDNVGLQQNDQYVWVHNNDFFYGDAGSDKDQVKGDGALDCKKSTYITFSYNHFFDNGKSNLLGLSEGTTEGLYITYHHNWYDHSDSRHPRVRFYSAHVYNNYYDGNAKYGIGSTLGSSIFAEANYFRNCKYPMLTSMQGSDVYAGTEKRDPANYGTFSKEAGGSIKAFNNYIEGGTFIPYGASKYTLKGVETAIGAIDSKKDFDAYVVTSRTQEMPATVTSYDGANKHNNFDLNLPYKYSVDAPAVAKTNVMTYAGRIKGGDFKWTFNNAVDDEKYEVDEKLKAALVAYKGTLKSIQGDGDIKPIETPVVSSSSVASSSSSVASSSSVNSSSSSSSKPASSSSVVVPEDGSATLTKHGSGSANQAVAQGAAVTEFYYTVAGATGATVTGLPEGLKGEMRGSNFYITGTVSSTAKVGEYKYTVKTNRGDSGDVTKSGVITVTSGGSTPAEESSSSETPASSSSSEKVDSSSSSNVNGDSSSSSEEGEDDGSEADDDAAIVASSKASAQVIRYNSRDCRLEISGDVRRLDIVRMDGRKVNVAQVPTSATSVDLNSLQPGVYLVRAVIDGQVFLQKIFKK